GRATGELGGGPSPRLVVGGRRYVAWHRARADEPAPQRTTVPARPTLLAPASVAILILGVLAGALAATMTRIQALDDPASLVGLMALLALPVAFIARIDWTRQRRDALVVAVTMIAGAAAARLGFAWTGAVVHLARGHAVLLVALGCAGAGALTGAR